MRFSFLFVRQALSIAGIALAVSGCGGGVEGLLAAGAAYAIIDSAVTSDTTSTSSSSTSSTSSCSSTCPDTAYGSGKNYSTMSSWYKNDPQCLTQIQAAESYRQAAISNCQAGSTTGATGNCNYYKQSVAVTVSYCPAH